MPKNVVICFEGGGETFSVSNVRRIFSVLQRDPTQVSYIGSWRGSRAALIHANYLERQWASIEAIAFGAGLTTSLSQAYRFLIQNFEPGDRLFLFGFSKGAFAAQALSALVHMFGMVAQGDEVLFEDTVRSFLSTSPASFGAARQTRTLYSQECKPWFVGLWETLASTGLIYNPLRLPYTSINPDVRIGRHALAIDERRSSFRPNLWRAAEPSQDIKEVWFAGAHSDVGGGYREPESGLAIIAFDWILAEAVKAGLVIDEAKLQVVKSSVPEVGPETTRVHRSLVNLWWMPELIPTRSIRLDPKTGSYSASYRIPMGESRRIPEGALIHESVFARMSVVPGYRPPNLPKIFETLFTEAVVSAGQNATFTRNDDPPGTPEPLTIAPTLLKPETDKANVKVFLCYVKKDDPIAHTLADRIIASGFEPWIPLERLQPGDDWKLMIPDMLRAADIVLICISRVFLTSADLAHWVMKVALEIADEKPENTTFIVPLRIDDSKLPARLENLVPVDYFHPSGWQRLLGVLQRISKYRVR